MSSDSENSGSNKRSENSSNTGLDLDKNTSGAIRTVEAFASSRENRESSARYTGHPSRFRHDIQSRNTHLRSPSNLPGNILART